MLKVSFLTCNTSFLWTETRILLLIDLTCSSQSWSHSHGYCLLWSTVWRIGTSIKLTVWECLIEVLRFMWNFSKQVLYTWQSAECRCNQLIVIFTIWTCSARHVFHGVPQVPWPSIRPLAHAVALLRCPFSPCCAANFCMLLHASDPEVGILLISLFL